MSRYAQCVAEGRYPSSIALITQILSMPTRTFHILGIYCQNLGTWGVSNSSILLSLQKINIVIPIYGRFQLLGKNLHSLQEEVSSTP